MHKDKNTVEISSIPPEEADKKEHAEKQHAEDVKCTTEEDKTLQ